jgi:hypothetical protein
MSEARSRRQLHAGRDPDGFVDGELRGFGPLRRARSLARSTGSVTGPGVAVGVTLGGLGLGLLLHPARLELRSRLLALEDRDLVTQLPDELVLPALFFKQLLDAPQQQLHQRCTLRFGNHRQWIRVGHARQGGTSGVELRLSR